jgi:uncharacterized protein (DUF1778 family)
MDKTETITIRLSPDTKDLLKRAATLKQMSIPEYCLTILDEQAAKDI